MISELLVGGFEHEFYFSIIYGDNPPHCLIFFRGVQTTKQELYREYMVIHILYIYHTPYNHISYLIIIW